MFTKIMVPLDGTDLAESILPYATHLASGLDVPVVLFNVADSARQSSDVSSINEMSAYLGNVGARLASAGLQVDSLISSGYAAGQIIRVARDQGCDLIATATRGRNIFGRIYRGSVTDSVIRRSRIPTLTVRPRQDGEPPANMGVVSRVIVPLDGSPLSDAALPFASDLAEALSLEVSLVRVINTGGPPTGTIPEVGYVELIPEVLTAAVEHLSIATANLRERGLKVASKLLVGAPLEGILGAVREDPGSLVVMSTHGRWGFARWSEGNVTHEVVRSSEAPVLVIPPRVEV